MSSTIKLKKSSIAGRVPSASDLEYGEIAINIADGKLYFKNSSNAIQSFEAGDLGVDSATVLSLIDSSHIQARQIDEGLDSAEVNTLIASGLQNAFSRILVDGQFDVVSDSTQDGLTLDAGHNITITTVPNDDTITFTTSAIGADSVTSLIDSSYVDLRLPSRMVTLTDSQELSNKTLTGPVLNSPVFGTGTNSPTFTEIRFNNSNIMKFNQMYTGASSGSYFSNGEYQKVATITPDGNSQNYQVVGRITAQNAGETHTVYFNAALRSNTLPDLNWSITYNEEYTGNRYIDPQLWTKETTTAGFIFAFKTLATIYGTVTVDFEVIPRTNAQLANVTVNSTQNSEQSAVDTGFTARDMTRTHAIIGNNVRLGAYTFPTADGNANQVLGTNGSGTLQFVNQTSGMDSASTIALVDSAYVQARQSTASDFDSSSAIGLIDSAYVQARQVDLQRDSAFITGLIDSSYIQARDNAGGTTVTSLDRSVFTYTTTSNQTVFTGADSDGNTLAFNNEVDVYLNGILLKQSDYVLSGGDTVTLDLATSADNILTIVDYGASVVTIPSQRTYEYTATANQTTFTGSDDNGNTLSYDVEKLNVYVNGILLATEDYTATNTTSVVLTTGAAVDDIVQVVAWKAAVTGELDSDATIALIDSAYIQARQLGSEITIQDEGSSLSTAATTLNFVGSAVTASGTGTTKTITITQAEGGTDSATVSNIIASDVDSAYVQARQSTTDLTNYRTVTQIQSMIDSDIDAIVDAAPGALDTLNELAAALGDDANFSTTVTNSIAAKIDSAQAIALIDSAHVALHSAIGKGDIDFGSNKITYSNVYSTTSDLPSASDYHGMFAHVHATGKGYFAHGGNWIELANHSQLANSSNWDTAYGWGDHSTQGYLTDAIDSARVTSLIDSDYVFSRVSETNYTYQLGTAADSNNNNGLNYLSTSAPGHGVAIQPDGSQLFVGDARTVKVWDTPSTTWDVSTYNRQSSYDKDFTSDIGSSNITDFGFNNDGTRMYIINGGSSIRQFDLSTAYRPSTATYSSTDYYNPADVGNLNGFGFSDDGYKLILSSGNITSTLGSNADGVRSYTLSTAWDVTTASYDSKEIITGYRGDDYERIPMSSYFANNGKDFFIFGQQQRRVQHFPLATAYDITSYTTRNQLDQMHNSGNYGNAVEIVFDQNLYIGVGNSNLGSVGFSSNGTYVGFNDLVRNLIDSDYVIARAPAAGLDSASTIAIIDSAYVQARQTAQDFSYSSLTGVPTTFAPDGVDSSATIALIDSAYIQARQSTASDFDSNSAIGLIDSAYVQARQTQAGGTDSAAVVALIDSNYIQARQANASPGATTIVTTNYTADSGDTSFAASYTIGKLNVYLNGILLVDSDDYTASNGSSVVLTSAADSGDTVQIISYVSEVVGTLDSAGVTALVDSAYVTARAGAGTDSATVSNIILSDVDSAYVVARNGFSNLRESNGTLIASGNILPGADSTYSIGTEDLKFKDLFLSGGTIYIDDLGLSANNNGTITIGQLDSTGFTAVGTIATVDSTQLGAIVDSAYLAARLTDFVSDTELSAFGYSTFDSTNAVGLIDSAYVQARQTTISSGATTVSTTTFTATAGQTTFTTSYTAGKINVYLNGILLVDTSDYTASNGTSVVLGTAAVANDILQVVKYTTQAVGTLDSAGVTELIDSDYVQARQDFAYGSLTGTPTIPTNNNQLTNGAGYITGYTVTESDVTGHEAALTITESQISDLGTYLTSSSLTNYRTVTQIQSMIDSDLDALVDAAPGSLNTLNELAAALGDDANFSTTVTNSIAAKLPLAGGTMSGAIAMGSNKITGLGTPTATTDAATKAYADTMLPLAGGTMSGNINLNNNELLNVNYLSFNDPGVEEGIRWTGGNGWQIFEAPNAMTNASGNLQFTTGSTTSDRMMTIDTSGNLELPTGRLTQVSDDPLRIRSSTNASPVSIEFSDLATSGSYSQYGTISYTHSDAASTSAGISGANEIFTIEGTEAVTGIKLDGRLLVTGTSEFQGDVDFGSNQITYSNVYSQTSDLPSASTYHGMFAHVHATGKGYFAHGGNWVELANNSDVPTDVSDLTDTTSLLGTGGLDSDATTNLIDSSYVAARTGNNSLTVNFKPDRKYARLTMSSNQTGISSTAALTTFNTRDVDTSPNNALTSTLADGKFIIPAGVTKVQLRASVKTSDVTDQVTMDIRKNGVATTGSTNLDISSTGRDHAAGYTGIIDVVENDYFQIFMFSSNSRTAEQDEYSWFEIEVVEGSMLNTAVASTIELSNLSNVDSASPSDGQALVWDSDNNYWKPGTVASGGGGGSGTVDSADIIAIVDSDYIQARQSTTGGTTITTGGAFAARTYHYTASANQTAFSGADDDGETLTITDSDANVYLNGILLKRTTDYTVGSNSITLQSGADSDNIISIVAYTGNHLDSNYISSRVSGGATTTSFTATANQTVFSGGGFTYKPDNLTVFYNGILLLDSDDYTATDGTSITLTSGATAGHKLTAVAYTMGTATGQGVDVTTRTFTATSGQTVFNNLDDDGNRLSYNVDNTAIYLNGILLSPADYTANNATSVVLTEAADSGNILTVMSYMGDQTTGTLTTISTWSEVSNTYTASHGDKLFVDVSSAPATVTLPASASMGDEVRIIDATGNAATNNITINKNGHNINGAADNLILDVNRAAIGLAYYNVAQGWVLMER